MNVLRRQLQIASATPGQEVRAAKLRQAILRLTVPLQEQHTLFVLEAKTLLTPSQERQLKTAADRVKAEQAIAGQRASVAVSGGAR